MPPVSKQNVFYIQGRDYYVYLDYGIITKQSNVEYKPNSVLLDNCSAYYVPRGKMLCIGSTGGQYCYIDYNSGIFWIGTRDFYGFSQYCLTRFTTVNLRGIEQAGISCGLLVRIPRGIARLLALYLAWKTNEQVAATGTPDFSGMNVPSRYRNISGGQYLYRAVKIDNHQDVLLERVGYIEVCGSVGSGSSIWTTDLRVAKESARKLGPDGRVVRLATNKVPIASVILNTNSLEYLDEMFKTQKEVILEGCGLDKVTPEDIVK